MKSYCLKWKKDIKSINLRVSNTSNGKTMLLSKYGKCSSKKLLKKQKANKQLSSLGIKTPLLGNIV